LKQKYDDFLTNFTFGEKLYIGLKINKEYESEIDLSAHLSAFLQHIEWEWMGENNAWDEKEIDFFVYLVDWDEFSPQVLGIDLNSM